MYRVGRSAFAHGVYIRPLYQEVWDEMDRQARAHGVSVSTFVNHALFVYMTGAEPEDSKLTGKNPLPGVTTVPVLPRKRRKSRMP